MYRQSPGLYHAPGFIDRTLRIALNVFQDLVTHNMIKLVIAERKTEDIEIRIIDLRYLRSVKIEKRTEPYRSTNREDSSRCALAIYDFLEAPIHVITGDMSTSG